LPRIDDTGMGLVGHQILPRSKYGMYRDCKTEVLQQVQKIEGVLEIAVGLGFLLTSAFPGDALIEIWICRSR
jgi:hypothetical protein